MKIDEMKKKKMNNLKKTNLAEPTVFDLSSEKKVKSAIKSDDFCKKSSGAFFYQALKSYQRELTKDQLTDVDQLVNSEILYWHYGAEFKKLKTLQTSANKKRAIEIVALLVLLQQKDISQFKTISIVARLFNISPDMFNPDNDQTVQNNMRKKSQKNKSIKKESRRFFFKKMGNIFLTSKSEAFNFNKLKKINTHEYKFVRLISNKKSNKLHPPVIVLDLISNQELKFGFSTFKKELREFLGFKAA